MYVLSAQTTLTIFAQKYIFVNAKILILSDIYEDSFGAKIIRDYI